MPPQNPSPWAQQFMTSVIEELERCMVATDRGLTNRRQVDRRRVVNFDWDMDLTGPNSSIYFIWPTVGGTWANIDIISPISIANLFRFFQVSPLTFVVDDWGHYLISGGRESFLVDVHILCRPSDWSQIETWPWPWMDRHFELPQDEAERVRRSFPVNRPLQRSELVLFDPDPVSDRGLMPEHPEYNRERDAPSLAISEVEHFFVAIMLNASLSLPGVYLHREGIYLIPMDAMGVIDIDPLVVTDWRVLEQLDTRRAHSFNVCPTDVYFSGYLLQPGGYLSQPTENQTWVEGYVVTSPSIWLQNENKTPIDEFIRQSLQRRRNATAKKLDVVDHPPSFWEKLGDDDLC